MTQKALIGCKSIRGLGRILDEYHAHLLFLVTGKKSFEQSGASEALKIALAKRQHTRFSDFSANPKLEDVERGIALFQKERHNVIVAIGGGTVLDMAKLINIFAAQEGAPQEYIHKKKQVTQKGVPLIAIPTTAGTGSEATHFAVVYIGKTKYSVAHEYILPNVAIVDARLTANLSPYLTASTGMDALSQAIESYWSVSSTHKSRGYAREAIKLLWPNIEKVVRAPEKTVRGKMAHGAYLAGKAINITATTAPHAVSYAFTSYFGVPHGHAVALTLPSFLTYNFDVCKEDTTDPRGHDYTREKIRDIVALLGAQSVKEARTKIEMCMNAIGLERNISRLRVKNKKDLALATENINVERLSNNPRKVTQEVLEKILEQIR